jgi:hypothetical protein
MIEKIGKVSNPLTIVAIFAAITEVSGSVVLPFLQAQNQATYLWFLMIFPGVLLLLFFATLNFNRQVLYAPSDYRDESNFFRNSPFSPVTSSEKQEKLDREVSELKAGSGEFRLQVGTAELRTKYARVEEAVLARLAHRLGGLKADKAIRTKDGERWIVDGIISTPNLDWIVEVKYVPNRSDAADRVRDTFSPVFRYWGEIEPQLRERLGLVIVETFPTSQRHMSFLLPYTPSRVLREFLTTYIIMMRKTSWVNRSKPDP